MKVLLVYCNSMLENATPISISQLSACLKQAGVTVELFDTTFYRYGEKSSMETRIDALQIAPCPLNFIEGGIEKDFIKKIETYGPDVIGFSMVEPTLNLARRLLRCAKGLIKKNGIKVAMGGVHAVLSPETLENDKIIDYISISEGEVAFVELCRRIEKGLDVKDMTGFWINDNGSWIKNQRAPLVDINILPGLDLSIFSEAYLNKPIMGRNFRTISIETTRGCPYHCSYCADRTLTEVFKPSGSWYRQKTMRRLEAEFKESITTYNPEFIYIMSESFLSGSLKRVMDFADIYRKFSIPFWFNTRPEDITEDKARLIKEIGCKRISIGLEHGNENYRRKYMYRNYSNSTFKRACSILTDHDISFSVNLIIGVPFDTRERIFEAVDLLREVKPQGVSTCIFNPYHGSDLRNVALKEKMIEPDLIADDFFQLGYHLNNNTISKEEIVGLFRTIPLYIEMDRSEMPRIEKAEKLNNQGNKVFEELKKDFYELKGWQNIDRK
jgi:anaerobic magnesium-protoporphyrin IX monomethyl ester cyclase